MSATALFATEVRRGLHRRAVWTLISVAMLGVIVLGVVAFVDSAGKSPEELGVNGTHPAVMADWWAPGTADGILMIGAVPLLLGGLIGGVTVAGAEWRAGTITTVLCWESRRLRLHAARVGACFVLATVIGLALEASFLAATVPAVLAHGTTAGVDSVWWASLLWAMARIAFLTGGAAVVGASLATLGRGTTFALAVVFGWMAIGETLVRGVKPGLQHLLAAENLAVVLTWAPLADASFSRAGPAAAVTLTVYMAVIAAAAGAAFHARDIAGVS